ncbi:MAG: VWA domain-containing protein [Planctomycetes bacterium]|nr:VWA domain-containing protein [Planctomycetota bacterium]
MTWMRFYNLHSLLLLWAIPLLLGLYWYAAHRRRQALEIFAEADLLKYINVSVSAAARRWKAALVIAAFAFIVLGLARPAWNPKPKTLRRRGRDVVFVLDVSKSMLAEDLVPNRLARAKLAILDCIERLQGDRVALVTFAGNAVVKCPLTLDYGFFRMTLEDISTESVSRGGTHIGDAIRKCLTDVFSEREKQFQDIILITDGEDHDSFPIEAAKKAGERGIRLLAIGIGDENQGKRIPITDEKGRKTFLKYKGQEVWSKLDADVLRKMVNATPGGKYLNVATGTIDLGDVYIKLVASAEKKELEAKTVKRYEEKFQIFLGMALVLLCLEMVLNDRKRSQSNGV